MTFFFERIYAMLLVLLSTACCACSVEALAREEHRSLDPLQIAWRSANTSYDGKKQIVQAAASHVFQDMSALDDYLDVTSEQDQKEFAAEVLSIVPRAESVPPLLALASDEKLPRRVRIVALHTLESFAGSAYQVVSTDVGQLASPPSLETRLTNIKQWFEHTPARVDGKHMDDLAVSLKTSIDQMQLVASKSRDIGNHQFEPSFDGVQAACDALGYSRDSIRAVSLLLNALVQLRNLPRFEPDDSLDRAIGLLEYQVLRCLESHSGPIAGLGEDMKSRSDVEPIISGVLTWWASAKDETPTTWRMAKLSEAGYKLSTTERETTIINELVRAVQSGQKAESKAASEVLLSLGIARWNVPGASDRISDMSAMIDEFVRATVVQQAIQQTLDGVRVSWDTHEGAWRAVRIDK
jgi:hypothetical protein